MIPSLPGQLDGVIVLNKPSGVSSAGCLGALKRLGQKKIGHAGTLDPMASGVLLALLGHATRISGHLLEGGEKIYAGTLELGRVTDTWDAEGVVLEKSDASGVLAEDVLAAVAAWEELASQPVPPYSAAKTGGRPFYALARQGETPPARSRNVKISRAEVLEISLPLVRFRVRCSSGTYIRSLAHSLGKRLGCGAVLTQLTREYSHPFGIEAAADPALFTADPAQLALRLRPVAEALPAWRSLALTADEAALVRNGRGLAARGERAGRPGEQALLMANGSVVALARLEAAPGGSRWLISRGMWR